jgi:hypothetical protein
VRRRIFSIILLTALLSLPGCSREVKQAEEQSGISGDYDSPQTWLRAARMHEDQGDLQRALFDYRVARTLSRHRGDIGRHLQRVERKIEEGAATLIQQAEHASSRGDNRRARALYLELLGLQPNHRKALAALRELDKKRSLLELKKKRESARRNQRNKRTIYGDEKYSDEGDSYTRQAILEAAARSKASGQLLTEMERHLDRYPKDSELRRRLIETGLALADKAYQAKQLDVALDYLNRAEQAIRNGEAQKQALLKARKHYAGELYSQGVISFRNEPQKALSYWRYALKFDPGDEKSRLRIKSMTRQ